MSSSHLKFLIIDGYSKQSRDHLERSGMTLAWKLYADMLVRHLPTAAYDILLPSDEGVAMPADDKLKTYAGIIWTGCDLTVYDTDHPSVAKQIDLAKRSFDIGGQSFGSCWAIQIAAVAAGGKVAAHPQGREMGLARKIHLTDTACSHPMFNGKPPVFDAFISHDDIVTELPPEALLLAGNTYSPIQAMAVTHKNGSFWATQYHPEYNLHEMARLIVAREEKLIRLGFFSTRKDVFDLVNKMEALYKDPTQRDLRWQLAIDDDVLDDKIRQCEFINWINTLIIPNLK